MNVSLTPELEQLVSGLVESGRYRSASEVVGEGLRLLAVRDEADRAKLEALRRLIQEGFDSGPAARHGRDHRDGSGRARTARCDDGGGGVGEGRALGW